VQGAIEEALLKLTGEAVILRGAGRTDAGVHALGQAAHFDLVREWSSEKLRGGLNAHLRPEPVAILSAEAVTPAFDARFSACRRHYRYRIANRRPPLALDRGRAWQVKHRLDHAVMHAAAQALLGTHDFTTFRSAECQSRSPVKTLEKLKVTRQADELVIETSARSFLHNQVRSLVGSLKLVGEGKWRPADVEAALDARDRARCGPVAPPDGLYLVRVDYPDA
ncbi:MAG: tRNA pseudouridine(38-40) synthase TruA, partial [Pseudomonadota bacterium]|nr:tRNA pseudouridine(38-40) synthase TruA [Pseudomonadota bacterium]